MAQLHLPINHHFQDILDALEEIWSKKTLPIDARLFMVGMVHAASVRQGDECFPRELFEAAQRDEPIHPEDQLQMCEKVHEFLFIDKKLRPSYTWVVLQRTLAYLTRTHQHMMDQFERKLNREASMN